MAPRSQLEMLQGYRNTKEGQNLLRAIRRAEGTEGVYEGNPYTMLYGGGQFKNTSRHPDQVVLGGKGSPNSAAAGAYQFMPSTFNEAQRALGLKDFGPESQDLAALWEADRRLSGVYGGENLGGLSYLRYGGMDKSAMNQLGGAWASFPDPEGKSHYGNLAVKSHEFIKRSYLGDEEYDSQNSVEALAKAKAWKNMSEEEKWKNLPPLPPLP